MRTFSAPAALALRGRLGGRRTPIALAAAAVELAGDKHPGHRLGRSRRACSAGWRASLFRWLGIAAALVGLTLALALAGLAARR